MLPATDEKSTSSMVSTRRPRLTLARIGFRLESNISSVMLNSVILTGTTRSLLHTNSVSGASIGTISSVPAWAIAFACWSCVLVG